MDKMKEFGKFLAIILAGIVFGFIMGSAKMQSQMTDRMSVLSKQYEGVINACYTCAPACKPPPESEQ